MGAARHLRWRLASAHTTVSCRLLHSAARPPALPVPAAHQDRLICVATIPAVARRARRSCAKRTRSLLLGADTRAAWYRSELPGCPNRRYDTFAPTATCVAVHTQTPACAQALQPACRTRSVHCSSGIPSAGPRQREQQDGTELQYWVSRKTPGSHAGAQRCVSLEKVRRARTGIPARRLRRGGRVRLQAAQLEQGVQPLHGLACAPQPLRQLGRQPPQRERHPRARACRAARPGRPSGSSADACLAGPVKIWRSEVCRPLGAQEQVPCASRKEKLPVTACLASGTRSTGRAHKQNAGSASP